MSALDGADGAVRAVLREVLAEMLPPLVSATLEQQPSPNGAATRAPTPAVAEGPIPRVPAPPVPMVHRPSGWAEPEPDPVQPAAGGSLERSRSAAGGAVVEEVAIESDADLAAFTLRLLRLLENPRDRQALRSGRLRFALRARQAPADTSTPSLRIDKGAVTERLVDEAASAGRRLVLGPRAVVTPMGRDRARQLGVLIEKEKR